MRSLSRRRPHRAIDSPSWKWKKLEAAPLIDAGRETWKLPGLITDVDANGDGTLTVAEVEGWLKTDVNLAALRRLVEKAQSEWDNRDPEDARWGWVKAMWADPVQHERAALKRRQDWVKGQNQKAEAGKPELQKRIQQASDLISKLEARKPGVVKALTEAGEKRVQAKKAKEDFVNNVGDQKTNWPPKTPAAEHERGVKERIKKLASAEEAAGKAEEEAKVRVKALDIAIGRAKAWKAREEAKLQAAEDVIQNAPKELDQLEEALQAATKKKVDPNGAQQADKDFADYKAYMKALQFWEQIPGLPDSKVWHFHPLAFVEFFKKCHWLSKGELEAIYPDGIYPRSKVQDPSAVREKYRIPLNRVMWKYGVVTPTRIAHFYGQARVESGGLAMMMEISQSKKMREDSKASEDGGYYKAPRDWYFTHYQHYQHVIGNKVQANWVNKKGEPFTEWDDINKESDENLKEAQENLKKAEGALKNLKKQKQEAEMALKALDKALSQAQASKDAKRVAEVTVSVEAKKKEIAEIGTHIQEQNTKLREAEQAIDQNKKEGDCRRDKLDKASENIDLAKSTTGDAIKFRGRGMKQLTGRGNYTDYWYYRGWISTEERAATQVDNPQLVGTVPFNCIDSGGWFFNSRSRGPISKFIREGDVGDPSTFNVSAAINGINKATGQPNGLKDRRTATREIDRAVNDDPLP